MNAENPITFAYCVELGCEVTITEARLEYLALESPPEKFHFLCSDPNCWDGPDGPGVMIVGANYRKPAEEGTKYRTPYFRREPRSADHREGCMWRAAEDGLPTETIMTESETVRRAARKKMKDLIDVFDPEGSDRKTQGSNGNIDCNLGNSPTHLHEVTPFRPHSKRNLLGHTQTSHFHRLIESYREAKEKLTKDDFSKLELRIKGEGVTRWVKYFRPIKYGIDFYGRHHTGVIYGGAKFYKWYGQGFVLNFFDQINKMPVSLYISSQQLQAYRLSRSLTRAINILADDKSLNKKSYVTVYAMGKIIPGKVDGTLALQVDDLRHLYFSISREEN